ncbi:MAG: hypothetical protein Q8N81_07510, partial [bacterium]|nr:hypothetical protein [bacterium]
KDDLQQAVLEIVYPDGFRFLESVPESTDGYGRSFNIGNISAGKSGAVKVTGIFSGSPQEIKSLQAKIFFQLKGTTARFSSTAESRVSLEAPDLNLRVSVAPQIIIAQRADYQISFQNISSDDLSRVQVRVLYPSGFVFSKSSLVSADNKVWEIGNLGTGGEANLGISGFLNGAAGDEKTLQVDVGYIDDGGNFILQNRAYVNTKLLPSPLTTSVTTNADDVMNEGEIVSFKVHYSNDGEQGMHNVRVYVEQEGEAVDLPTIRVDGGALVGRRVLWNPSGIPALSVVQPGQNGDLGFTFTVRKNLVDAGVKNPFYKASVHITADELPEPVPGGETSFKVRSQLVLHPRVEYVSGERSLKPEQESVLRVRFHLDNTVNDVSETVWQSVLNVPAADVIESSLPAGMFGKDFKFVKNSGRITWNIGKISALSDKEIEFLISVRPSVVDQLSNFLLVKDIQASAVDDFTGEPINQTKGEAQVTYQGY